MTPERIYADDMAEVWHADSLNPGHVTVVMGDRIANALIVDAPYSEATHSGHRDGKLTADRAAGFGRAKSTKPTAESRYSGRKAQRGTSGRRDIDYEPWTPDTVRVFVEQWAPRCRGWFVSLTDHVLGPEWEYRAKQAGLLSFAPLPFVETGSRVRVTGDGPSSWTCWVIVARPRTADFARWGTLPGAYVVPGERRFNSSGGSDRVVGGKPLSGMLGIVGDYSRTGDLVVDPCCGASTTGVAAKIIGRRYIGIDKLREHAELSAKRLANTRVQVALPLGDDRDMAQQAWVWAEERAT